MSELFTVISAYMRWSLTSPFKKLFRFQPNATQGVKKQIHDGIGGQVISDVYNSDEVQGLIGDAWGNLGTQYNIWVANNATSGLRVFGG